MTSKLTRLTFLVIGAMTLAACASAPRPPAGPLGGTDQLISIENRPGPFCGRCDNIKITAMSDGRVWIEHGYWAGDYRDWRVIRRLEQVPPDRFALLREALQPYRPKGDLVLHGEPPCQTLLQDLDGARIEWSDAGRRDRLILNFGCDPELNKAMADAVRAAPSLLGINGLKMPWGQWVATTGG